MTDSQNEKASSEASLMNKLVRAARAGSEEGFVRPDAEDITAYVMRTATPEQAEIVTTAMVRSGAFRAEILAMAHDIDALGDVDPLADKKKAEQVAVPDRAAFLAGRGEPATRTRGGDSVWARLWRWRVPQVLVPVAVAASVLVVAVLRTKSPPPVMLEFERAMERAELISRTPRGLSQSALEHTYSTPEEAATAAFRSLLEFKDGEFGFRSLKLGVSDAGAHRAVAVTILDASGRERASLLVPVASDAPDRLNPWVLILDGEELLYAGGEFSSNQMRIEWPKGVATRGCLAFTYGSEGAYRIGGACTVELE